MVWTMFHMRHLRAALRIAPFYGPSLLIVQGTWTSMQQSRRRRSRQSKLARMVGMTHKIRPRGTKEKTPRTFLRSYRNDAVAMG